jgi:hypothetical protein
VLFSFTGIALDQFPGISIVSKGKGKKSQTSFSEVRTEVLNPGGKKPIPFSRGTVYLFIGKSGIVYRFGT